MFFFNNKFKMDILNLFSEKIKVINELDEQISKKFDIIYNVKYKLIDKIKEYNIEYYINSWYRCDHLHPFNTCDWNEDTDPPLSEELKEYNLYMEPETNGSMINCLYPNCEFYRSGNLFCSQHMIHNNNPNLFIEQKINDMIQERKEILNNIYEPVANIEISYYDEDSEDRIIATIVLDSYTIGKDEHEHEDEY